MNTRLEDKWEQEIGWRGNNALKISRLNGVEILQLSEMIMLPFTHSKYGLDNLTRFWKRLHTLQF